MKFRKRKNTDTGLLVLDGELTIQRASELKDLFVKALKKSRYLELKFEKVTEIDLSCIQVIYSAYQTAKSLGVEIIDSDSSSDVFKRALETVGLTFQELQLISTRETMEIVQ